MKELNILDFLPARLLFGADRYPLVRIRSRTSRFAPEKMLNTNLVLTFKRLSLVREFPFLKATGSSSFSISNL